MQVDSQTYSKRSWEQKTPQGELVFRIIYILIWDDKNYLEQRTKGKGSEESKEEVEYDNLREEV